MKRKTTTPTPSITGAQIKKGEWLARRFGYRPKGRSQDFLAQAMAAQAKLPPDAIGERFQGGSFCTQEYDADRMR